LIVDSVTCRAYVKLSARLKVEYPSLAEDLGDLCADIAKARNLQSVGDCIPRLKYPEIAGKIWKFRVADTTDNRGKSYGFRVIGFLRTPTILYFITIYEHKKKDDVTRDECKKLVRQLEADIRSANEPGAPPSQ